MSKIGVTRDLRRVSQDAIERAKEAVRAPNAGRASNCPRPDRWQRCWPCNWSTARGPGPLAQGFPRSAAAPV
ncbi:MAG: hypothetical protein R3E96_12440 [Planctomycetota bacterium]